MLEKVFAYLNMHSVNLDVVWEDLTSAIDEVGIQKVRKLIREENNICPTIVKFVDIDKWGFKTAGYEVLVDYKKAYVSEFYCDVPGYFAYSANVYLPFDHPKYNGHYLYKWIEQGEICEECGVAFIPNRRETLCRMCDVIPMEYSTKAETILGFEDTKETLFGIELEYEKVTARDVKISIGHHAIAKRDGSITNGVEVVTKPACIATHKECLKSFFDTVKVKKYPNTGMHVHVDKSKLSNYQIGFMLEFLNSESLVPHIEKVAGREYSKNTYCKSNPAMKMTWGTSFDSDSNKLVRIPTSKYAPLNTLKPTTIEIRIFSSPESHLEMAAKLDFVNALVKYSSPYSVSVKSLKDKFNWETFLGFVVSNKKEFPDFVSYFVKG